MARTLVLVIGLGVTAGAVVWAVRASGAQAGRVEGVGPMGGDLPAVLVEPRIVVRKGARTLTVFSGGEAVATWPIGLGHAPEGHKQRRGDGRTPIGKYRVCVKNPQSRYHLSLGLDYPNRADVDAALAGGRIDAATHGRLIAELDAGRRAPWDSPLGGEIYIHGHGAHADWTLGCIALDDAVMEQLYYAVGVGTPVVIEE